jgi:predicted RNA binding protein YcfA (HicA-like mRNA interferase family)
MPKLRRLFGHEVVAILKPFGFLVVAQRGSHIKLKRMGPDGAQVLTIPAHTSLDVGPSAPSFVKPVGSFPTISCTRIFITPE